MEKDIVSIWDLDEFAPYHAKFKARSALLQWREQFYLGTMYNPTVDNGHHAWPLHLQAGRVKRNIRVLFHPLAGAVMVDVALVPGEWQLDTDSLPYQEAVRRVLKLSRWHSEGDLYVHYGACMGQTTLKVVHNATTRTAMIQTLRPDLVLPIYGEGYDSTLHTAIVLSEFSGQELAEVITPNTVRTYLSGHLTSINGNPHTVINPLGFVPIIDQPFIHIGHHLGEPTYAPAIEPLRGVNEQATDLDRNIKRHIEPQWAAFVENPKTNATELVKSGDNVWWFPRGADIKALVADLDINGVLGLIKEVKDELKEAVFELLIFKLVGITRVAVPAVEVQLMPLTLKIQRIRRSLDNGLADALKMVGRCTALLGGDPQIAAIDDPLLGLDDKRPIFFIDALTQLELERAALTNEQARQMARQQRLMEGDNNG